MAGWDRVTFFHRAETQGAKLFRSRKVLSARLQLGKDPAIVTNEIVELLAALNEVRIPVHEEFIWLHFGDNLPPGYEFIKKNLQCSKEPLTRTVLEGALRSRYNVQSGGKKGRTISNSALFVSGSKAGRGVGRGRGRGGTYKGKLDSRGGSDCPEHQRFKCRGGVTRLFPAHLRFRLRRTMETKKKEGRVSCYGGKSSTRFRGNN